MKHLILLTIITFLSSVQLVAQSTQKGMTLEYQGKQAKTALGKVQVVASGASAMSADDGSFTLTFQTLKRGDKVNVNRIAKSGYVIFNKDALEQWFVTGSSETFKVVLCKSQLFDDLVNTYYGVSMQSYSDQLQKAQAEARRLKAQGKIKEEELNQRLREAEEAYQRAMDQLQANSELMARIDESELDSLDQQALDLTKAGRMDEAVALIKQKNTSELIQQTIRKRDEAATQQQYFEQKQQEAKEQLNHLIASRKNDIKILRAQGGKENLDLCKQYWIEIAEADTTDVDNTFDCAYFLQGQNDFQLAERFYSITLNRYRQLAAANPDAYNPDVAISLNNLAVLHKNLYNYAQAEQEYNEALAIYRQLAAANPDAYNPDLAMSLNNLAALHYDLQNYDQSEQEYNEALAIRRQLAAANPDAYNPDVARTLYNLAILHKNLYNYAQAEQENNEALAIRRQLAAANPDAYNPDLAMSLNNLANLHRSLQNYAQAEQEYNEALAIRRQLAAANPDAYNPDLAMSLNNLAALHSDLQNYAQAEQEYNEALAIRRQLAAANPDAYNPDLVMSLNNLGGLHLVLNNYVQAEQEYNEALAIRRQLAAANPDAFNPDVARTLFALGILHSDLQNYDQSEQEYNEALAIRRQLAATNPDAFNPDLAISLYNLAFLHYNLQNYPQAEQEYNEALAIFRQLAAANPDAFNPFLVEVLFNISVINSKMQKYPEAEATMKKCIELCQVIEFDPSTIAGAQGSLSYYQLFNQKFVEAEQSAREAIALDPSQTWIKTNLVSAMLLQGRYAEAEALAREIKDVLWNDVPLKNSILDDLDALEQYGAIPTARQADVEHLRTVLMNNE